MNFAVSGSGFGLYGYLPALAEEGISVCLPEKYRNKFDGRSELQRYAERIFWFRDTHCALQEADGIVVAKRPVEQSEIAISLMQRENIKYILLEKPLAATPAQSLQLLNALREASRHFRIAYLFVYTKWCDILKELIQNPEILTIHISWNFMAYHFRNNLNIWKCYNSQGGGAIRFYGIQAIALMAFLKYTSVQDSVSEGEEDRPERWQAAFIRKGSPTVQWSINSRASTEEFSITAFLSPAAKKVCYTDATPFASANLSDARIEPLRLHIRSLFTGIDNDEKYWDWYNNTIDLQHAVECLNTQQIIR